MKAARFLGLSWSLSYLRPLQCSRHDTERNQIPNQDIFSVFKFRCLAMNLWPLKVAFVGVLMYIQVSSGAKSVSRLSRMVDTTMPSIGSALPYKLIQGRHIVRPSGRSLSKSFTIG